MGWLDKLLGNEKLVLDPIKVGVSVNLGATDDPRVVHEYFVADAAENGRWPWLCRVYDKHSVAHQMTGSEETEAQAKSAAQTWAKGKKDELRGAP